MQRLPKALIFNIQAPNAYGTDAYVAPANTWTTISAASFNNTSAAAVTLSVSIIPAAGSQANSNEIVTNLSIPAAGAAPTVATALIGQTLAPGERIQLKAGAATAITPRISGYETTQ